ncbi:oxidoreductase, FAD/FMN dependent [Bacteriovorax sp. BSW11_IV]|uniref:alkene reductase n=1 Tax=Bacteriovorax sp. BSW11_IV TaxID=1353529 RepID=UPI00038A24E3|nr:alkene reductase [Bacteriovorax sp. BSW11_IV]EQC50137.1 oxidoreductase, FAD/FMN dependent [Bacteriovorax sp. BSW11_IV]
MTNLFSPLKLGSLDLKNRIIMAPLTRARAGDERIPNELMVEYYSQRASAGMILTEATAITPSAVGYAKTPGIWSQEQVIGWKKITDAVHAKGSKIFMQLWHVGRISHSMFLNGKAPVAPSAVRPAGHVSLVRPVTEFEMPRALETEEVAQIVVDYKKAAMNAKEAGFDGVEIHAANGYLIDQFMQDSTNKREDQYGGSIENRARFLLEITDALIEVWGADRVGVHLAPRCDAHDMGDSNPLKLFSYVVSELDKRNIAFIFTREAQAPDSISPELKKLFKGVFISNEKFTKDSANKALSENIADAISFGVPFIANPDLVERFEKDAPLNAPVFETFYNPDHVGYTDYPALENNGI